jgi:hypothetical protein
LRRANFIGTKSGGGESEGAAEGGCGGNSAAPERQNSALGFSSKKVRILTKRLRLFTKLSMIRVFYYLSRVLSIIFILFISLFALDSFDGDGSIWVKIGGFLIHLIPSYVLIIAAIIAWKNEFVGGIAYFVLGFFAILWLRDNLASLLIVIPLFIIGALFLAASRYKET